MAAVALVLQLFFAMLVVAEMPMQFTKYPESVIAPAGDKVTFECALKVPAERLTWRWRREDRPHDKWTVVEEGASVDKDKMATSLMVEVRDDSPVVLYQCVVTYASISLASVPAKLTTARLFSRQSHPEVRVLSAPVGNTVVMHCREPRSEPPAEITWWKENTRNTLDSAYGVLVLRNVTAADRGTYGCSATNELTGQTRELPDVTKLEVQNEARGRPRFLERDDYVGTVDRDGDLSVSVRVNDTLRLWCGAVDTPAPHVSWTSPNGMLMPHRPDQALVITSFTADDEGIYTCTVHSTHSFRRAWKVSALEGPYWLGSLAPESSTTEGQAVHIDCGTPVGHPPPAVHWLLNAQPLNGRGANITGAHLYINPVEKSHAGIIQCFACNELGCAYDATLLTVFPVQISDQEYTAEASQLHIPNSQPPKRHGSRKKGKHNGKKSDMIPPSRPNVTRMSDDSVMVTWSHSNQGLPILFFKIQYREVNESAPNQWCTANNEISSHVHSYKIDQLKPDKYYKFRIAAVYSNQDNSQSKSSSKFYLKRGRNLPIPKAPVLVEAMPMSSNSIRLEWTWSKADGVEADGFYVHYRVSTTAGDYELLEVPGGAAARHAALAHLAPDTSYEIKVQAFTAEAPSEFSARLVAKTLKSSLAGTSTEPAPEPPAERAPAALVTAGGALGAAALVVVLVVTLLLCRRAKRPPANKEKGSVPESGANGYIPAKVPITITANPMHAEQGSDGGVEMSFLHNNNTGSNDDTLPHSRKNGPVRQYV